MTQQAIIEREFFQHFFNEYLIKNNCTDYISFRQRYAKLDFIATSGETEVAIECKIRKGSISQYANIFIEETKIRSFKAASNLFGTASVYLMKFNDCVLMFDLSKMIESDIKYYQRELRRNNRTDETEMKNVFDLEYRNADFIISTNGHKYRRASFEPLNQYLHARHY